MLALLFLWTGQVQAADEELTLLTIEGDLISKIDSISDATPPATIIATYYAVLPAQSLTRAEAMRDRLRRLIPDYEVAYNAADSAEITQVRSDIFLVWAGIRTLHAEQFSAEAAGQLDDAYRAAYATVLAEQ
ncbi:MAG: hypothetical protein RL120_09815 [Gammaproteobacteria bacterium]